jgi:hypothetical protein
MIHDVRFLLVPGDIAPILPTSAHEGNGEEGEMPHLLPQLIPVLFEGPVIFAGSQTETVHITANTARQGGQGSVGPQQRRV